MNFSQLVKRFDYKKKTNLECACSNCENKTYCLTEYSCYKSFNSNACQNQVCYGCFTSRMQTLQCELSQDQIKPNILCCNQHSYCNWNLTENLELKNNQTINISERNANAIGFGFSLGLFVVLIGTILLITCRSRSKKHFKNPSDESMNHLRDKLKKSAIQNRSNYLASINNSNKNEISPTKLTKNVKEDEDAITVMSSTSTGAGTSELIQRTIARDLHIDYSRGVIGQGRYGAVWTAKWNNDIVAVKVFFSMFEHSWSRETEIYQTSMLRNENILGYIASDIKGNGCSVNMLLITEYHPLGSLYDFLQSNFVEKNLIFRFLYSICNGLNHLHQEIISQAQHKPSIAHRDLKTKNILVKSNYECCLADFGLAVRFNSGINQLDYGNSFPKAISTREGTVRYMPPECLNETINVESFESFRRADIYQLSLVIWELLICCQTGKTNEDYESHRLPYSEFVNGDPDVSVMKDIVCSQRLRPTFKREFEEEDLKSLVEIMKECWSENPNGRLNALSIKKKLKKTVIND